MQIYVILFINGDLVVSKVWFSGGRIYYALKVTDPNTIFLTYNWSGKLTMHYYASGSKKQEPSVIVLEA